MSDHQPTEQKPAPAKPQEDGMHKVDEGVQEDAAKERAENGGYD